jgi:membrane protease YdiL (CAAX protease family)
MTEQRVLGWRDVSLIIGSVFGLYALFYWLANRVDLLPDEFRAAVVTLDLVVIGLVVSLILLRGFPLLRSLRVGRVTKHDVNMVLLLTLGLALATTGYSLLLEAFTFLPDWLWDLPIEVPETSVGWFFEWLSVALTGPIMEECIFRGVIQPVAIRRCGALRGIWLTSLLFGAAHMVPLPALAHLLWSVAVGLAVYRTGSLMSGVFLHAANNVMVLASVYFADDPDADLIGLHPEWWQLVFVLVAMAGGIALSLWALRRMKKETSGSTASIPEL